MKSASAALTALINAAGGQNPLVEFDFYTFTLQDGTQLRYGGAPFQLTAADPTIWNPPSIDGLGGLWFSGITWPVSAMGVAGDFGSQGHWKVGLDTDTWLLKFAPRAFDPFTLAAFPDQINGVPWLQAAQGGALDSADLIVSTAYFAAMPAGPLPLVGVSPVGTLVTFRGVVGDVDCSDTAAYININDYRGILSQMMPRNLYQAPCRHRLFDVRCTLLPAGFTKTGAAGLASSTTALTANAPVAAPGGSNTFAGGVMTITSGLNAGFKRYVRSWDGSAAFGLLNPFPFPIANGDTFSVTAGCDKVLNTCAAFGNTANYGGNPYIPVPEIQIA